VVTQRRVREQAMQWHEMQDFRLERDQNGVTQTEAWNDRSMQDAEDDVHIEGIGGDLDILSRGRAKIRKFASLREFARNSRRQSA
jgi:hypothetical protein